MINSRIEELINYFSQGNKSLFSKQIGVTPSVIGNITGERKGNPSFDVVNKIINAFVNIDANWLITGQGSMLRTTTPVESPQTTIQPPNDDIVALYEKQLKEKETKIDLLNQEIGMLKSDNKKLMEQVVGLDISECKSSISPSQSPSKDAPSAPVHL